MGRAEEKQSVADEHRGTVHRIVDDVVLDLRQPQHVRAVVVVEEVQICPVGVLAGEDLDQRQRLRGRLGERQVALAASVHRGGRAVDVLVDLLIVLKNAGVFFVELLHADRVELLDAELLERVQARLQLGLDQIERDLKRLEVPVSALCHHQRRQQLGEAVESVKSQVRFGDRRDVERVLGTSAAEHLPNEQLEQRRGERWRDVKKHHFAAREGFGGCRLGLRLRTDEARRGRLERQIAVTVRSLAVAECGVHGGVDQLALLFLWRSADCVLDEVDVFGVYGDGKRKPILANTEAFIKHLHKHLIKFPLLFLMDRMKEIISY